MILNIGDRMTLIEITKQLINHIHFLKDQFFVKQLEQDEREYFAQVKKETEPIFSLLKNWEEKSLQYVKQTKSVVHFKQINATKENIELMIIHAYFKDMRKRRFMEYYNSSLYVLQQLEGELSNA